MPKQSQDSFGGILLDDPTDEFGGIAVEEESTPPRAPVPESFSIPEGVPTQVTPERLEQLYQSGELRRPPDWEAVRKRIALQEEKSVPVDKTFAETISEPIAEAQEGLVRPEVAERAIALTTPALARFPGVTKSLGEAASGFTSPMNMLMLGAGGELAAIPKIGMAAVRGVAGGFAADMAQHFPELWRATQEAKTPEEKQKAWTDLAITGGMTGLAGLGTFMPGVRPQAPVPPRIVEAMAKGDGAGLTKATQALADRVREQPKQEVKSAIQEQGPDPGVLRQERPEVELQGVREPQVETAIAREPARAQGGAEGQVLLTPVEKFTADVESGTVATTQAAHEFGSTLTTREEIIQLKRAYEQARERGRAALKALRENPTDAQAAEAIALSQKPQYFNEAIDAATGADKVKLTDAARFQELREAGKPIKEAPTPEPAPTAPTPPNQPAGRPVVAVPEVPAQSRIIRRSDYKTEQEWADAVADTERWASDPNQFSNRRGPSLYEPWTASVLQVVPVGDGFAVEYSGQRVGYGKTEAAAIKAAEATHRNFRGNAPLQLSPATESTATTVPRTGSPSLEEIGVRPGESISKDARVEPFFERESEVAGLGRSSLPPTVVDVRAQRAADAARAVAQSPIANARLAAERPIQEPYSEKHSVSLQVAATEFPKGSEAAVRSSLPKELADKVESVRFFKGEVVSTNKAMSVPARVELVFKDKAGAQAAIDYFKEPAIAEPVLESTPLDPQSGAPVAVKVPDTLGETVKMRKSAERAIESPQIPEPVQERIEAAPESRYTQQSMKRVEQEVAGMTREQLRAIPKESDLYTAARLEEAKQLFQEGKNDEGYSVFVELEKEGTRLGQLINQFKLLEGTRPEEIVAVLNKTLEKSKKDILNPEQTKQAMEVAARAKESDTKLDSATDAWVKNPTAENARVAEAALDKANAEAVELQKFVAKFQPRSTSGILKSVLQGNLLTPISEVANLFGNMSFLPFRAMDRGIATGLDMIDATLRNKPRELSVQPLAGTAEALRGAGRGFQKIPDILIEGTGNVIKGETRAGLHPIKAWINQFARNPEMPTTGGKLTLQDRLNLAIEGTFGVPAEVMLRGLGAGDIVPKEAARARATAEQLKLNKVPRDQWPFAQKFPELFLPKAALEQIGRDTAAAVFQRESKTLNVITNWLRGKGEIVDFLAATVAPYKLTPWNIIGEILSYNPLIAMTRGVMDAKKGNTRSAKLNAGKFAVGSMLTGAGVWLYNKGLLAPSLDERDEAQKGRVLAGEVLPPNHINISGLKRAMGGGDSTFKAGDETADIFRGGGLAGSIFYMTANIGRDFERGPEVSDSDLWMSIIRQSTLEQARFGMNQSFLSGVEGLLTAIKDGNADTYVRQWANTVTSIPLPNTLNTISRSSREYKPDFKADQFKDQIKNQLRGKLGDTEGLPLKRDFWGEPMRETPEGRDAIFYHFFDISKNKQVTSDPVELELYRLWRKTADSAVIPSLPSRNLTLAQTSYALDPQQYEKYAELVGKNRREIVDALVINPNFHQLTDEQKIDVLERAYRDGLARGKALFYQEHQGALVPKTGRAGFNVGLSIE